jgi:hypothetical protein
MFERRNHSMRADVLRRVVDWLRAQTAPALRVPESVAEPTVALRILKRLAVTGLVRRSPAGWLPSPVLVRPPQLLAFPSFAYEET